VALSISLSGCVTIVEGTSQNISVATNPPGATCVFERQGVTTGMITSTPGTLKVRKSKYDITIKCTKPGFQEANYLDHSGTSAYIAGNVATDLLLTAGISSIVDSADGADNKYESAVNISLVPQVGREGMPSNIDDSARAIRGDKGRATFFRESHFVGSLIEARVKVDGREVGTVSNGAALEIEIPSGEPKIVIDSALGFASLTIPLKVEAGMAYYIEVAAQSPIPAAGVVPYLLGGLKSKVDQYCNSDWCAGIIEKNEALPKIQNLGLETPRGQ
jgi:hypothetical protein